MFTLLVWTAACMVLFATMLVGPIVWQLTRSAPVARQTELSATLLHLHGSLWLPLGGLFVCLAFVFLRVTHRVAGPLYRFRQVFTRVGHGDLTVRVRIRQRDYLGRECGALDEMIRALRTRARDAQTAFAALRAELVDKAGVCASLDANTTARLLGRADRVETALAVFLTEVPEQGDQSDRLEHPAHRDAGFSLVELLIVACTISTLAALAIPGYQVALDRARITRATGDINAVGKELTMYQLSQSCFPATLSAIGRDALRDPWGNPYAYAVARRPGGGGRGGGSGSCGACGGACVSPGQARKDKNLVPINSDFDLYSAGKDGRTAGPLTAADSKDDIVRGRDGGFIGPASEF